MKRIFRPTKHPKLPVKILSGCQFAVNWAFPLLLQF